MPRATSLKPYLIASDSDIRRKFRELESQKDVAALLEIAPRTLRWILYVAKERKHYSEHAIPKKDGEVRRICIPTKNIRILQDKLLRVLTLIFNPRMCVTGFTRDRCILDNAQLHIGKRYVLNLDLDNFFPSIHIGRVRGILKSAPYSLGSGAALTIGQIACHDDGHLPQGAPTSPILANMVCSPLDYSLLELAKEYRLVYTRYADDISFSTNQRKFPPEVATIDALGTCHLGKNLVETINNHKFSIRDGKTRLRTSLRRQMATGLVVNEFVNVPRNYIRELRALIHSCQTVGIASAAKIHAEKHHRTILGDSGNWILNVIRGKLAYLSMVRGSEDHIVRRLQNDALRINRNIFKSPIPLCDQNGQPIQRRSRLSPNWKLWSSKYSDCVFRLLCVNPNTEDENYGTAFRVGPIQFLTAGHNRILRASDGNEVERNLYLTLPLDSSIELTCIKAICGEQGDIDLAFGSAELPEEWTNSFILTQERLPVIGEEVIALGYPDIAFRHVGLVMHVGRIESVMKGYREARFLTVSFEGGPAISGAPLLDANGYCIGVMVENSFRKPANDAPHRPYGQAIAIGHWRDIPGVGTKLTNSC